jgi:Na+-translocating ferredoxin:NAD+ oxidoreductase subunit G
MAKLESSFKNMVLVLTTVSCVSAALLGGAYALTYDAIQFSETQKKEMAIQAVAPKFENSPTQEAFWVNLTPGDSLRVYPIKQAGALVAYAVESNTKNGFGGEIAVMVGYQLDGTVINYSVLKHAETPGLGTKMVDWFNDKTKPNQCVLERNIASKPLSVSKDNGEIDAITAATISSRAFLDAINRGYEAVRQASTITPNTNLEKPE